VGMIFTAMSTDYYPRLSAVAHDVTKSNKLINQQAEMAILFLGPILILFLISLKYAIILLYSDEFLNVVPMVQWAVLAIFLKAIAWATGFIFISKNSTQLFFYNELIVNCYTLAMSIIGYHFYGIEGLGIAFLIAYLMATIQTIIIIKFKFNFSIEIQLTKIFSVQILMGFLCLFLLRNANGWLMNLSTLCCLLVVSVYSIVEINKRVDIKAILMKIFGRHG
jgi:O-antigen/teichoic acid export membrane protein